MKHNMMKHTARSALLTVTGITAALTLAACSNTKDQLGLTRQAPDEFAVVKRAPLSMPPDYNIRPPQPGAARPQETTTSTQARETVFGQSGDTDTAAQNATRADSAEALLLQKTGAAQADPGIRQIVDAETQALKPKEQPAAKKLLNWGKDPKPPADVVDAKAEAARLRQNKEEGKTVTEGDTPSFEE